MTENIKHIHEVLFMIMDKESYCCEEALIADIREKMGKDVRFCSCSDTTFPPEDVVSFLTDRKKIKVSDNGRISTSDDMEMCDSHEKHP